MITLFKCALLQKQIPHYAHLQGEPFATYEDNTSILYNFTYFYPR